MKNNWYRLNLCAFSDGEGEGAEISETGDEKALANADAVQENGTALSAETDRAEQFRNLIDGEFKDEFTKRMQSIIDKRFKETKLLETEKESLSPLLSHLYKQHNIEDGDLSALNEAIIKDKGNSEREQLEAFNKANMEVSEWLKQSEQLKQVYPSFDFREEVKGNDTFITLLKAGIPVKTAYEVIHKDEIIGGAMEYTAQKVSEHVVKGLEAKASRPQENGLGAKSAIAQKTDVNALTAKDITEILKQVEAGANIKF